MNKEIWQDIEGYEGLYQVSNFGRVKSLNYRHTEREQILKPGKNRKDGYLFVGLNKNGKRKMFKVHRLVATAFLSNPNNFPQINHKDENPENNFLENLEYCDCKYNNNFGTRNERIGEKNTNGKLSKPILQLTLDGEFVCEWPSINEAGRCGYNLGAVCRCCRGERKTHKGFVWKYKEEVS